MKIIKTVNDLLGSKRFKTETKNKVFLDSEVTFITPLLRYILNDEGLQNCAYGTMIMIVLHSSEDSLIRYIKLKENPTARTHESYRLRHGMIEGDKRWAIYKNKQAETNSFEYKQKKYGWSREQFNEYNKSRAVTLANLIKKYGEHDGTKKWEHYIERQRYTNTQEYFIEKYGNQGTQKWLAYNKEKSKSQSIDFIMTKYKINENEAISLLSERRKGGNHFSQSELEFVNLLEEALGSEIKYTIKTKQYGIWNKELHKINFYDIADHNSKKIIEFNGDYWHCNPSKYNKDYVHHHSGKRAKTIWDEDNAKINSATRRGFNVKIVWYSDFANNKEKTIKEIAAWWQQK